MQNHLKQMQNHNKVLCGLYACMHAHALDNKMDACFEERLCEEIRRYPHLTINLSNYY